MTDNQQQSEARPRRFGFGFGLALLFVGLVFGGCSDEKEQVKETVVEVEVVARVGDRTISVTDLENELERLHSRGRPITDQAAVLDEIVAREAMLQRAASIGLTDDADVRRELDNLLIAKLWEREFETAADALSVSDEELRAEYGRRLESEFTRPAKVRLAILMLNADSHMSEAKKNGLRDRLNEARALAIAEPPSTGRGPATLGFGKVAIDFSEDQVSRYRGGDIGWFMDGNLEHHVPAEVLKTGYALKPKEISDVIETSIGFYLITKTDSRPAEVVSFEKAAPVLKQSLLVNKKRALRRGFLDESRGLAGVTVNSNYLNRIQVPDPGMKVVSRNPAMGVPGLPVVGVEKK